MQPPLTITLPSDREIAVTRTFKASADLVFDCWTIPALIRRWLGPADWVFVTCEFDARVGGKWRFVTKGPGGFEMGSCQSSRRSTSGSWSTASRCRRPHGRRTSGWRSSPNCR